MAKKTANTAVAPVIIKPDLARPPMTAEQFDREKKYRAAMALAKAMLASDVIGDEDFSRIQTHFMEKFTPPLGPLLC